MERLQTNVAAYVPLVHSIAAAMLGGPQYVPPALDYDDLVQEGVVGLLEAAGRFDPARGVKFTTFATPRVRGAMQDAVRRWHSRSAWALAVGKQSGDPPPDPVAALPAIAVSEEAAVYGRHVPDAVAALEADEAVLVVGHLEGDTFEDLARRLGVTRVTACRRHRKALAAMRRQLVGRRHHGRPMLAAA